MSLRDASDGLREVNAILLEMIQACKNRERDDEEEDRKENPKFYPPVDWRIYRIVNQPHFEKSNPEGIG